MTQNASVDKMEETEVFKEIILDGCAGEEDAARGSQLGQSRVCLVLTVLQSMTLHTDTQIVCHDEHIHYLRAYPMKQLYCTWLDIHVEYCRFKSLHVQYICMHVCMYVCMYVCIYVCIYVCSMYVCMYVCIHACM